MGVDSLWSVLCGLRCRIRDGVVKVGDTLTPSVTTRQHHQYYTDNDNGWLNCLTLPNQFNERNFVLNTNFSQKVK